MMGEELATFDMLTQMDVESVAVNDYRTPGYPVPAKLTAEEFGQLPAEQSAIARRAQIRSLEKAILDQFPGSEVGPEPAHLFADGLYFRQLTMPAGLVIVSKRHAQEHVCTVSKGRALVFTEDGQTIISAPHSWVSPAGSKRALLILEEMTWATVHKTDAKTVEDAEADIIMDERGLLQ